MKNRLEHLARTALSLAIVALIAASALLAPTLARWACNAGDVREQFRRAAEPIGNASGPDVEEALRRQGDVGNVVVDEQ